MSPSFAQFRPRTQIFAVLWDIGVQREALSSSEMFSLLQTLLLSLSSDEELIISLQCPPTRAGDVTPRTELL